MEGDGPVRATSTLISTIIFYFSSQSPCPALLMHLVGENTPTSSTRMFIETPYKSKASHTCMLLLAFELAAL